MSIKLGVPLASVLGRLFFSYFNDLVYKMKAECKMLADDATLYDAHDDINSLISKFKKYLETLIAWCRFNKLDLNWSKTFFMFITNKRVKLPNEIYIDGVYVKVVDSFKLLGVIIDNKLNFSEQCLNIKKLVNIKLYIVLNGFLLIYNSKNSIF